MKKWGTTPWTRIEETSIRNRAHEEGYDFTIFIPMAKGIGVPNWVPKNKLWVGLERWGIESAAAVVEARVQEQGGVPHAESLEDRAARQHKEMNAEKSRKQFLSSEAGVQSAREEVQKLRDIISERIKNLPLHIEERKVGELALDLLCESVGMHIGFQYRYCNTLENASLDITLWRGVPPGPGRFHYEQPTQLGSKKFVFDRDWSGNLGWQVAHSNGTLVSTDRLAEECIQFLLDRVHKESTKA